MLLPTGGLLAWGMVRRIPGRPGEPEMIEADPEIVEWLFGRLAPELLAGVTIAAAVAPKPLPQISTARWPRWRIRTGGGWWICCASARWPRGSWRASSACHRPR